MLYILVGKSGSGKTTISRCLHEMFGVYRVRTCTTRPKRDDERDGIDYHFISDDAFQKLEKHHELMESRTYDASFGRVSYGSFRRDYYPSNLYSKRVLILNPDGILRLKDVGVFDEGIFDKIRVIYLDISEDKLKERLLKRGDSLCEINRRLEADRNDFEELNGFEPLYRLNCTNMNPIDICKTIINLR